MNFLLLKKNHANNICYHMLCLVITCMGLDLEFNSVHFEINKLKKFLTPKNVWV